MANQHKASSFQQVADKESDQQRLLLVLHKWQAVQQIKADKQQEGQELAKPVRPVSLPAQLPVLAPVRYGFIHNEVHLSDSGGKL